MLPDRKQLWWGLTGAVIVYIITVLGTSLVLTAKDNGRIPPNTFIAGIPVGGLPYEKAKEKLLAGISERIDNGVVFSSKDKNVSVARQDCHIGIDIEQSLARSQDEGWAGWQEMVIHSLSRAKRRDLPIVFTWNRGNLEQVIRKLSSEFDVPAKDARIIWRDDSLEYIPHENGRKVDQETTLRRLEQSLAAGKLGPVSIAFKTVYPRVKLDDIKTVKDTLGVYVTTFDPNQKARTNNLKLAAASIDGTIIMPDQVFSLNEALGPRSEKDGYQKAPVFANNRVVQDVGGGICQVATTLYNAVLQAGLEIIERRPHSRPISYAPLGLDATISSTAGTDMKFRNNTDFPVMISISVKDDKLIARIFGCQTYAGRKIRVETEKKEIQPRVVVKSDPALPEGSRVVKQAGKKGYLVKIYRVVSENGRDVEKTLLSEDYYRPTDMIILVGPNGSGEMK